jgi:hypothetical protein
MTIRVKIKAGDFGMTYTFTLEGVDYSTASGYTPTLWVWKGDTLLVNGHAVTSSTYAGGDTTIVYTVADGDFPATLSTYSTIGVWNAEFKFTKGSAPVTLTERTETFEWEILEPSPAT